MALNVWTKPSGYSFGTLQERVLLNPNIQLPVNGTSDVTYTVISGQLPGGLRLIGNEIVGTPFEVSRITNFVFCIRAKKGNEFSDRTFAITIEGADAPEFITPAGDLAIGSSQQFFVLDSSFVDYQITAFDNDTSTGQKLTYFIGEDEIKTVMVLMTELYTMLLPTILLLDLLTDTTVIFMILFFTISSYQLVCQENLIKIMNLL